jgi:hypothetical protein
VENQRVPSFVEHARPHFEQMGELMYRVSYSYTECGWGLESTDPIVALVCERAASSSTAKSAAARRRRGCRTGRGTQQTRVQGGTVCRDQGGTPYVLEGSSMGADSFGVLTLEG